MTKANPLPLAGLAVLVTRAPGQAKAFAGSLQALGAEVIEVPMVEFIPPTSCQAADAAIAELTSFDWIVFASANAVRFFFKRLDDLGVARDRLAPVRVAVVGKATAEVAAEFGLRIDLLPDRFNAEGLVEEFERLRMSGQRVLIPRAEEGRELLPSRLAAMGAEVTVAPVYRTVAPWHLSPGHRPGIDLSTIDVLTFSSPSTVRHFLELFPAAEILARHARGMLIAVIGPTTRNAALAAGLPVDLMPAEATFEALVQSILQARTGQRIQT